MTKHDLIERLKELRPHLAAEGVEHLAVFGSRARGDHGPESDVDLLVEFAPASQPSILNLIGVEHIIGDNIGLVAHASARDGLKSSFYDRIAPDIVAVF